MKKIVTIAGSDATGGGGIEADLKTFQEFGTFGFAAITSIVSFNPKNRTHSLDSLSLELIQKQIDSAFAGPIDAIKTGLLPSAEAVNLVSQNLAGRSEIIVVDPVIGGKGTSDFLNAANVAALRKNLLPLASVITPNLREAGILSQLGELKNQTQQEAAAKILYQLGAKNIVIKGSHKKSEGQTSDLFYDGQAFHYFSHEVMDTPYNHGAGCTFAAALTASLAKGYPLQAAVQLSIDFVQAAIAAGVKINDSVGHVWHGAYLHAEKRLEYPHE